MRLKLLLQYSGHGLYGWQAQAKPRKLPTVQGHLIDAFKKLKVGTVEPVAAGRTDAGVHALAQTVHVDVPKRMELIKYLGGLNRFLPHSIRVIRVAEVTEKFHARFSAQNRSYRYLIYNGRNLPPHLKGHVGHAIKPLQFTDMQKALAKLPLGEHDFSAFRDSECQAVSPLCRILSRKLTRVKDPLGTPLIAFDISADHFLHHMVRNIVGTLAEVGEGKRDTNNLLQVLKGKDRRAAGLNFSPDGLYFVGVSYPKHKELGFID
ncbi:MAG TPA: tRNA pseudouridine(38-40) synthase TruA [Alphaproteobacteria bacterium]|nr:tRNA pseudouridine(38-40) synthase TruA [Alphaproteobacteria bacterium]